MNIINTRNSDYKFTDFFSVSLFEYFQEIYRIIEMFNDLTENNIVPFSFIQTFKIISKNVAMTDILIP